MKDEKTLLQRDKAFCDASIQHGEQAWKAFLSKDVIMGTKLHEPYLEGRDKVVSIMEFIYHLPEIDFTWDPKYAFVSKDHTLGVTTGTYTRRYRLDNETMEEIGKYVTTWKWIKDNWYVIFDMGN